MPITLIEVLGNETFCIFDHEGNVLCELPASLPKLSSQSDKNISKNAQHWKKVHSLTEKLYKKFLELDPHLAFCEEYFQRGYQNEAETRLRVSYTLLRYMRQDIKDFGDELRRLPRSVSQTGPILGLRKIPLCYYAMKQSLGSPLNSPDFANGVGLSRRIAELLYLGLHIADKVLEEYFILESIK